MIQPIEFINTLRSSDKYIQDIYTQGGCWQFHKVLKAMYPNVTPYKVKSDKWCIEYDHIISKIGKDFYDITGNVNHMYFDRKSVEEKDVEEFEKWTFGKRHYFAIECPNCGELVP